MSRVWLEAELKVGVAGNELGGEALGAVEA